MTQVFTADGLAVPATVIALEEGNVVTCVKTVEKDGYAAVQVGYRACKESKITKPELGHLQKAGVAPMRKLKEFKVKDVSSYEPGQQLQVEEMFKVGDLVDVAGTTIGKGFQGKSINRLQLVRALVNTGQLQQLCCCVQP